MTDDLWLAAASEEWPALVGGTRLADSYQGAAYHRLAVQRGEGEARLFVCRDSTGWLGMPLLVRPIEALPGRSDAGSVYGYAGPIASTDSPSTALVDAFQERLEAHLRGLGIVSLVARLNPLLGQAAWIGPLVIRLQSRSRPARSRACMA